MDEEKRLISLETIADIYLALSLIAGAIMVLFAVLFPFDIGIYGLYGVVTILQGFLINYLCRAIAVIGKTLLKIESNTKLIK